VILPGPTGFFHLYREFGPILRKGTPSLSYCPYFFLARPSCCSDELVPFQYSFLLLRSSLVDSLQSLCSDVQPPKIPQRWLSYLSRIKSGSRQPPPNFFPFHRLSRLATRPTMPRSQKVYSPSPVRSARLPVRPLKKSNSTAVVFNSWDSQNPLRSLGFHSN